MSHKSFEVQARARNKTGEFSAIVSPFGGEPDAHGDLIDNHAYDRFIKEWRESGAVLPVLDGHDNTNSTADIGWIKELEAVPDVGLFAIGQLDVAGNERARYAHKLMIEKRRVEFSIGYRLYPGGAKRLQSGATLLTAIKLREISLVLEGAARTELLTVKAAASIAECDYVDALAAQGLPPEPAPLALSLLEKGVDADLVRSVFGEDAVPHFEEEDKFAGLPLRDALALKGVPQEVIATVYRDREKEAAERARIALETVKQASDAATMNGSVSEADRDSRLLSEIAAEKSRIAAREAERARDIADNDLVWTPKGLI